MRIGWIRQNSVGKQKQLSKKVTGREFQLLLLTLLIVINMKILSSSVMK